MERNPIEQLFADLRTISDEREWTRTYVTLVNRLFEAGLLDTVRDSGALKRACDAFRERSDG